MASSTRNNPKYIYDLPYFARMELCRILDQNDKWEELGGTFMNFDVLTIQALRREILRGNSPADELLTKWGHQNHTILELFVLLSKMQHYQAMLTIKQFVDPEYHRLIYEGEQNLSRLFQSRCPKSRLNVVNANDQQIGEGIQAVHSRLQAPLLNTKEFNLCKRQDEQPHRTLTGNQQHGNGNYEVKILNNDIQIHPGELNPVKNSEVQTILAKKEGNAVANPSDLLRPKLVKEESSKDKNISEISSIAESVGILPLITFKEIEEATNGWDQSSILGKGGFGTVYKGTWKNTQVAIKRTKNCDTDENKTAQIQQILGELKMLNSYRHDNILPLYGFSLGAEEPCLIYQYLPNGSLEDRLLCRQGSKPLSWFQRHNIATGTARGLQFLHTIGEKPLIHGDIKSANILLDSNFEPKIGDFGLAREGPYNHYTHMKVSKVHGTRPYLPDEFLRHKKFSTKVDTHSFGIVMFELATGLRAYDDQRSHKFLKDLIENSNDQELALLMDKKCGPDDQQTFPNLIMLGKCCTSRKPKERPEMVTVLQELNAMAVKRNTILKVQNLMKHNSVSPLNAFDVQVIHDHLSQQKRISPASSISAVHRAVSPLQPSFPTPETSRAVSPVVNQLVNQKIQQVNNFLPADPGRNENTIRKESQSVSPAISNAFDIDRKSDCNPFVPNKKNSELKPAPPIISVSPPSVSQSSTCEDESCEHDTNKLNENLEDYTSDFDNVLPLISELGIKAKYNKAEQAVISHEESGEIQTSAKGKSLWVLEDTT